MQRSQSNRIQGVTLIELLVGLTVGAIVLVGVLFAWGLAVRNNAYVLGVTALNNDMRSLMHIVTQDVRRAAQNDGGQTVEVSDDGTCIAFNAIYLETFLDEVADDVVSRAVWRPSGYRYTNGDFQVWRDADDTNLALGRCDGNDARWETLLQSGDRGVTLSEFEVDAGDSICVAMATPVDLDPVSTWEEAVTPGLCSPTTKESVELILLRFTLAGTLELAGASRVFEFTDSVKIRNDRVLP